MMNLLIGFQFQITKRIGDKFMTREQAKELLPIMQAYSEGKTIQIKKEGDWLEVGENTEVYFSESPSDYRIKPEPKYRPFKTQEECWQEMLKHQPFGWLKSKKNGRFRCIGEVYWSDKFETVCIVLSTSESLSRSSDSVFDGYTFADGAPFGVIEE